ncbi:DUF6338 family protein [Oscillibacter sp.]|uniref:DUF6338 family protein n=1 Tax=Oscillibacter sp. TaxID=1945593 RepID=UPI003392224B
MELSNFTFKLLFIFLPGIIAVIVISSFKDNDEEKPNMYQFFINSLIYGLFSYIVLYNIYGLINVLFKTQLKMVFLDLLWNDNFSLDYNEVLYAAIIAVALSLIISKLYNSGAIFRFAGKIGISKSTGAFDVWNNIMRKKVQGEEPCWIVVRNKANDTIYEGCLSECSTTHNEAELVLENVKVYKNETAELCYDIDSVYLSFQKDNVVLEFPRLEQTGGETSE